ELVVVPHRDDRGLGVQGLQVGVRLVGAVPQTVVGEGDDLVGRRVRADDGAAGAVAAAGVLVDVVAQMQPGVQVAAGGEVAVGGEVPCLPVGARDDTEAESADGGVGGRGGAGAADGGVVAAGREADPVVGGRLQAADVGLHGVVGGGGGEGGPLRDDVGERLVPGDGPAHLGVRADPRARRRLGHRRHPRPQQDAVRQRVAGGDPVQEGGRLSGGPGGQRGGQRPGQHRGGGGSLDDRTAARREGLHVRGGGNRAL